MHVDHPVLDDLRHADPGVEMMETSNPDPVHPEKILPDAFLRDVAVHPVPPQERTSLPRGLGKSGLQVGERLGRLFDRTTDG